MPPPTSHAAPISSRHSQQQPPHVTSSNGISGDDVRAGGKAGTFTVERGKANELLVVRALVTRDDAASLIGRNGANIRWINSKARVRTVFSANVEGVSDRILTVTGQLSAVAKAFGLIADHMIGNLEVEQGETSEEASYGTLQLLIPDSMAGAIIGKGGVQIKELQRNSKARIMVGKEVLRGSTEKILSVQGNPESLENAVLSLGRVIIEYAVLSFGTLYYNPGDVAAHEQSSKETTVAYEDDYAPAPSERAAPSTHVVRPKAQAQEPTPEERVPARPKPPAKPQNVQQPAAPRPKTVTQQQQNPLPQAKATSQASAPAPPPAAGRSKTASQPAPALAPAPDANWGPVPQEQSYAEEETPYKQTNSSTRGNGTGARGGRGRRGARGGAWRQNGRGGAGRGNGRARRDEGVEPSGDASAGDYTQHDAIDSQSPSPVPPPAASRDVRPTEARARPGQRSSSEPPAARSTPVREASVEANYRHVAPAASPDHLPEDNCGKDFEDTADSAHNGPPRATVCYMCGRSGHQVSWCYETERLCSEGVVYLDKSRGKPVVRFYDGTGVVFGRDMFEKGLCMLDVIEGNAGEGRQRQQEQQNGDSGFGGGGGDARRGKGGVRGRGNGYVDRGRGSWRLRGGRRENREAGSDGQHYGNGNGNGPSRQNGYVE